MASLQLCSGTWSSVKWGAIQEGFLQVWVQQEEDIVREQGPGGWGNCGMGVGVTGEHQWGEVTLWWVGETVP